MEVWQWLLLGILGLLLYILYNTKYGKYSKMPPQVPGLPYFGNVLQLNDPLRLHHDLMELGRTHGDIFTVSLFGDRIVNINSAEMLCHIDDEAGEDFSDRPTASYALKRIFYNCDGIIFKKYSQTLRFLRSCATKAFSDLEAHNTALLEEEAVKLVDSLLAYEGQPVRVCDEIKRTMANVLTVPLLGKRYEYEDTSRVVEFWELLVDIIAPGFGVELEHLPFLRKFPLFSVKLLRRAEELRKTYVEDEFYRIKASFDRHNKRCVVDKLLDAMESKYKVYPDFTDKTIKGIMVDLMLAGAHATSTWMSGCVMVLLNQPETQARLQKELDAVIGQSKMPSAADLDNMPFFESFLTETLRLFSIGTTALRATHNDTHYRRYFIPKGTNVLYNLWAANHDARVYDDPWSCRPDRFLDDHGKFLPADHPLRKKTLPFGVGKRLCIGQAFAKNRVFIFLAILLQRLSFLPCPGKPVPPYDPRTFKQSLQLTPPAIDAKIVPRD